MSNEYTNVPSFIYESTNSIKFLTYLNDDAKDKSLIFFQEEILIPEPCLHRTDKTYFLLTTCRSAFYLNVLVNWEESTIQTEGSEVSVLKFRFHTNNVA